MVADRLEAIGPVTLADLVEDMSRQPGLPWAWLTQRHQAELDARRRAWERSVETTGSTLQRSYDAALGWHHESYDVRDPRRLREALHRGVWRVLHNGQRYGRQAGGWVIREGDTYRRNPDGHPRGWTPQQRTASQERSRAQVAVINESSWKRQLASLSQAERVALVRILASDLPVDRAAATRVGRSALLRELRAASVGDMTCLLEWIAAATLRSAPIRPAPCAHVWKYH
jgi:hypothetical protein